MGNKVDVAQNRVAPWIIAGISYTTYCNNNGCTKPICPKAVCWLGRNDMEDSMDEYMDECLGKEELSDEEMEKKVAECLGEEKTKRDDEAQNRVAPWIIAGISYTTYCNNNGCTKPICPKAVCWLGRNDNKVDVAQNRVAPWIIA